MFVRVQDVSECWGRVELLGNPLLIHLDTVVDFRCPTESSSESGWSSHNDKDSDFPPPPARLSPFEVAVPWMQEVTVVLVVAAMPTIKGWEPYRENWQVDGPSQGSGGEDGWSGGFGEGGRRHAGAGSVMLSSESTPTMEERVRPPLIIIEADLTGSRLPAGDPFFVLMMRPCC